MVNAVSTSPGRLVSLRAFPVSLALAALLAAGGAGAAVAQTSAADPVTGLRGSSAATAGGLTAGDSAASPSGSTRAGLTVSGETTAGTKGRRAPKPNPTRPPRAAKVKLPPLVSYRGARLANEKAGLRGTSENPPPTVAALPFPATRRPRVEESPFAPVGVRLGSLTLRPALELDGGYNDNPNSVHANAKGSAFGRAGAALDAQSDWAVHELKANLRGGYTKFLQARDADRPDLTGTANLRLDATRDTAILIDAKASIDSQRPGSPEITSIGTRGATLEGRPLVFSEGVSAGVRQKFGRLEATLRGSLDRTDYQDGSLSDGSKLALSGTSYTTYGASARLGYEITPGVKPFVEASVDKRVHDVSVDANGYRRDSEGVTGRAGTSFEITRTLTGEASAGYTQRRYEDSRLKDLRGPVFDAALIWTASPLTTVTLKGSTAFEESTITGASGSINRRASVQISHALLRNLTLTGSAAYGERDYQGVHLKEKTLSLGLGAEYALTRTVVVKGSFTHDRLMSTSPNADYTANVFLLGLRLQR